MAEEIFTYKFAGRKGQRDVGWADASWYDYKNIHVPIDRLDGDVVHWVVWESEEQSYYADDQPWNKFASPEMIIRWGDFLPAHEHDLFLNDIGQTYNWFQGGRPFHSRLARPTMLKKGQVELTFELYADAYRWDGGKKPMSEVSDANGPRMEMHIVDTGLNEQLGWGTDETWNKRHQETLKSHLATLPGRHDDWFVANPSLGEHTFTRTLDVPRDGLYLVVFGAMCVWAVPQGSGRNGLWGKSMGAKQVTASDSSGAGDFTTMPIDLRPIAGQTPGGTTGTRGAPRVQYERTFKLIHNSVPENMALSIFKQARAAGQTIGFSPDDAGLGDLDIKIVEVYGWPTAEVNELQQFFATYYPGTQVRFMPMG